MKLNQQRAKQSAIDTGAAVAGAVVAHAGTQYLASLADDDSSPLAKIKGHLPALMLGAAIAVQALDLVPNSDAVSSALLGASVVSGMAAVREYSGANDATKNTAGLAEMVNKYVPGYASASTAPLAGLGYSPYSEMPGLATSLLSAGSQQRALAPAMGSTPQRVAGGAAPAFAA